MHCNYLETCRCSEEAKLTIERHSTPTLILILLILRIILIRGLASKFPRTFESAIPHSLRYLRSVSRVFSVGKRFVQRQGVEDYGVMKSSHETVRLKEQSIKMQRSSHRDQLREKTSDYRTHHTSAIAI